jgi:hypothetical protein
MFFEVVTGDHHHKPRKHTIIVKPGEKLSLDVTAGPVGDWAFHCHLLYHMMAGMMQIVSVQPGEKKHDADMHHPAKHAPEQKKHMDHQGHAPKQDEHHMNHGGHGDHH